MKIIPLSENNIHNLIVTVYLEGLLQGHTNERNQPITQPAEAFAEACYEKHKKLFDAFVVDIQAHFLNLGP